MGVQVGRPPFGPFAWVSEFNLPDPFSDFYINYVVSPSMLQGFFGCEVRVMGWPPILYFLHLKRLLR